MFLGRASLRNTTDWLLLKLFGPDYWVPNEVFTNLFFMIKKKIFKKDFLFFFKKNFLFKKDLYFVYNTNIFCVKIYFWNEIYFFTFSSIFFCINFFFHIKTFFSPKNTNILSKKFFFYLVLQQMNNHSKWTTPLIRLFYLFQIYTCYFNSLSIVTSLVQINSLHHFSQLERYQ